MAWLVGMVALLALVAWIGTRSPIGRRGVSEHPVSGARARAAPEREAAACFVVATVAAIALAVVYWEGGQPQAEGVLLALSLGGIGTGIVLWAKHFMPDEVVEERRRSSRARR